MNIADKPYNELISVCNNHSDTSFAGVLKAMRVLPPERTAMLSAVCLLALAARGNEPVAEAAIAAINSFIEEARWKSL